MKIKNFSTVIEQLKPLLKEYLERNDTKFTRAHFSCPNRKWHKNNDDKPSCSFYPDENHFHCFVCGSSGDIYNAANFLEDISIEGNDFVEATIYLTKIFNIPIEVEEDEFDKQSRKLYSLLELIRDVSYKTYQNSEEAKQYVIKRNLQEIADKVKFGYCNFNKLLEFIKTKGYTEQDLIDAGLASNGNNISSIILNERLLIPVYNEYNKLVAFCSRRIKEDGTERYYNSSTSQIYKKLDTLYNFNNTKHCETIVIFEGHLNVLTCMKHGINNTVALGGTAISQEYINKLVKYGVKKVVLCLDNDNAGKEALKDAIKVLSPITELTIQVMELEEAKDADEYINKFGIEKFQNIPIKSVFDFKLEKYINSGLDKNLKEDLLQYISTEQSYIEKEQMCKKLAKGANVRQETVINEIELIEKIKVGDYGVTTADIVNEKSVLLKEVLLFENWAQSRGKLLGLGMSQYPIMTEKLDGIQNCLYIVAVEENTGKSAFTVSLMLNLATSNPGKVFILYFGLDVSTRTMVARMVANCSGLPINTVSNPKYKIAENPEIVNKEELLSKREGAIEAVRGLIESISVKDEKTIRSIEDMERIIKVYQKLHHDKQLVVIIDSLNQMSTTAKKETRDLYMYISDKCKEWTIKFDIPVFAISELRKLQHPGMRPTNDDIKEASDFKYDADATILIYNELHSRRESKRTFIDSNGLVHPIVEFIFFKNKTSGFKGTLFYKFYTDISKVEECTIDEMRVYWSEQR